MNRIIILTLFSTYTLLFFSPGISTPVLADSVQPTCPSGLDITVRCPDSCPNSTGEVCCDSSNNMIGGSCARASCPNGYTMDKPTMVCTNSSSTESTWDFNKIFTCGPHVPEPGGISRMRGIDTAIGCIQTDSLSQFLAFILKWTLGASGGIILLMLVATGYSLLTSSGNPEKLQAVKENLVSIFSGLILIGFSLVLLQTIGAGILKLPTF